MDHLPLPLSPFNAPKSRNHPLWRWYERLTALIGWAALPVIALVFWNKIAGVSGWPVYLDDYSTFLWSYLGAAIAWIIKADVIKYRVTRDPRDDPFRKWYSFKHAQKFKPGERVFVRNEGFKIGPGSLIAKCKECGHVHGFPEDQANTTHDCGIYACKGVIDLTDPANYSICTR